MANQNEPLPDGIYLNLPADRYHRDPALGSTDLRALRRGAKVTVDTPATVVGTAMHAMILDGKAEFQRRYVRRPDDSDGMTPSEKGAVTKAAKAKLREHQDLLHGDDYDLVCDVATIIAAHPDMNGCFEGALHEVSVFWTREDGVRCKCRFDGLKPRGIGDLKSIANENNLPLDVACMLDIKRRRYDIQAAHYMESRRQLPALVAKDLIFDWRMAEAPSADGKVLLNISKDDAAFLHKVAEQKTFAFQFIFVPKNGARTVWGCVLSPGNPLLDHAAGHVEEAVAIFKKNPEFLTAPGWAIIKPVRELMAEDIPGGDWGWH